MLPRQLPQPLQEALRWSNRPRIAHHRFQNDTSNQLRMRFKRPFHRRQIVIRQRQRMHRRLCRHSRRPGNPKRRHAAPRLHQHPIRVPVIAAFKLDHKRPPRKPARQPYRRHARLCTRRHKPHLLHRRKALLHQFRQVRLIRGARTKRRTPPRGLANRLHRWLKRMPKNHRPPRAKQIHVAVPIRIKQVRSFAPLHKRRMPTHRAERPHRRIHAPRQILLRPHL